MRMGRKDVTAMKSISPIVRPRGKRDRGTEGNLDRIQRGVVEEITPRLAAGGRRRGETHLTKGRRFPNRKGETLPTKGEANGIYQITHLFGKLFYTHLR